MADYSTKGVIEKVTKGDDYYSITMKDSYGFGLDKKYKAKPRVGDEIEVISYNGPFGTIKGVYLNGEKVFYKTDEEIEAEHEARVKEMNERDKRNFEENKAKLDARYDSLPPIFRQRIDRFRRNNPDFRVKFESYELFCCEEAVKIADACGDPSKVQAFSLMQYETQKLAVPGLSDDHSGNTFGMATHLAYWYLQEIENVVKMHGSLSTLVGSEAYGDIDVNETQDVK